jgi:fucose permease
MAGPALLTAVLAAGASWRLGYAVVGATLVALVPAFVATRRRWEAPAGQPEVILDAPGGVGPLSLGHSPPGALRALRAGAVRLQIAIFFLYAGVEVAVGQWSYTILTEARGLDGTVAGAWVTAYWGGLLAGRVVLGLVVERVGQVPMLRLATGGVLACAVAFAVSGPTAGGAALPLLSFCLASIYPGLMSETPRRVGEGAAPHAVGFQVSAATLGVAVVPGAAGVAGERLGLEAIGWVVAGCALALLALHERLVAVADGGAPRRPGSRDAL